MHRDAHENAARDYIDHIRNPLKRDYAASFYHYLLHGGEEPPRPEGLSYMAAQAVRLELTNRLSRHARDLGGAHAERLRVVVADRAV